MKCSLTSSTNQQIFTGLTSVTLPALTGELQILSNHAESFIALKQGQLILIGDKTNPLPVAGGVCHVKDNVITVIL